MTWRIAVVSEHASPLAALGGVDAGGQNVHVANLAEHLARLGAEVVVHTRRDDAGLPAQVTLAPGVVVDHVPAGPPAPLPKDELLPFMGDFAAHLRHQWRYRAPDLVHGHFWMSGLAALAAAGPLGVPVVQTFHALGVVKRRYQGSRDTSPAERVDREREIMGDVHHILATCTDELFELSRLGVDAERISVVPCGVDTRHFRPDGRAERRRGQRWRIVVVGRVVERKGVGNAITALARVPDTELVVAGGPDHADLITDPEARRLISLARREGVADRVDFRGRVERARLPALLRSADAVVCVPWYEPFGIVPLEAMACGVPVVGSAVGGLLDSVVDGVTGVHVPPRAPERLAEVLRELLPDQALRGQMGRAGVLRARERFTWRRVAQETLQAYRRVLDGDAGAGADREPEAEAAAVAASGAG